LPLESGSDFMLVDIERLQVIILVSSFKLSHCLVSLKLFVDKIVLPLESHPLKNNAHTKSKGKRKFFMCYQKEN